MHVGREGVADMVVDDVVDKTVGAHHHVTCGHAVISGVDCGVRRVEIDVADRGVVDVSEAIVKPVLKVCEDLFDQQCAVDRTCHARQHGAVMIVGGVEQFAHGRGCDDRVEVGIFRRDLIEEFGSF